MNTNLESFFHKYKSIHIVLTCNAITTVAYEDAAAGTFSIFNATYLFFTVIFLALLLLFTIILTQIKKTHYMYL